MLMDIRKSWIRAPQSMENILKVIEGVREPVSIADFRSVRQK